MISKNDMSVILKYAKKYKLKKIILFGSSKERTEARDIDVGVQGVAPDIEIYLNRWMLSI
jgi:predicted nucleotidyltransferase